MRRVLDSLAWVAVVVVVGGVVAWNTRPEPPEYSGREWAAPHTPRHASCCESCLQSLVEESYESGQESEPPKVGVQLGVGVAETIEVSQAARR